jgi:hypothetical protein
MAYACQIEILETLACLVLTLNVEAVRPFDTLRRPMELAVMPLYEMDGRSVMVNDLLVSGAFRA